VLYVGSLNNLTYHQEHTFQHRSNYIEHILFIVWYFIAISNLFWNIKRLKPRPLDVVQVGGVFIIIVYLGGFFGFSIDFVISVIL